jgi:hypothetical protein
MVQTAMTAVADPRKGPDKMISNTHRSRFVPVIVAIALAATLAACSAGVGASAPSPSAPPAPATPAPATPAPATPAPTGEPAPNLHVDLTSTSGQDVTIDILDGSRSVTGARSGSPAEGVSVDSESVLVENIDARTLRLTWSDFPIDNKLKLLVDPLGVGYRLVVVQPAPTGPADAMGEDRILELAFDRDISAAEVEASIQEGLDVPG